MLPTCYRSVKGMCPRVPTVPAVEPEPRNAEAQHGVGDRREEAEGPAVPLPLSGAQ